MKIIKYFLPLVLIASVALSGSMTYSHLFASQNEATVCNTPPKPEYIDEQELWTLIGNYKQKNSLQVPIRDERLCTIAKMRLGVVANDWSHDGFFGGWVEKIYPYSDMWENLAKDQDSANQVLQDWINSPVHNSVLLRNYSDACVQCANINQTNYCVYISAI